MKSISNVLSKINPAWQFRPILWFILFTSLLFITACSKDEDPTTPTEAIDDNLIKSEGISGDELATFKGELGIVLDARPYFRKGQPVAKVRITPTDSNIFEALILDLDEFSNYAIFKLAIENLSDEAVSALKEGVNLEVDLLDENETELFKETLENTLFKDDNSKVLLRGDNVPDLNTAVDLNPDTPYFLQLITAEGLIETKALDTGDNFVFGDTPEEFLNVCPDVRTRFSGTPSLNSEADFASDNVTQQFYFQQHAEQNVFSIVSRASNTYLINDANLSLPIIGDIDLGFIVTSNVTRTTSFESLNETFKFQIRKENGAYKLFPYRSDRPLAFSTPVLPSALTTCTDVVGNEFPVSLTTLSLNSSGEGQNFRIVASGVKYTSEPISTWYGQPVLPPAENSFKFNSTLKNCTTRDITQTIGAEVEESTKMVVTWEETIGLTESTTGSAEVEVEVEASANFFGSGVTVSGSVSTKVELSTAYSESSSIAEGNENSVTKTIFSERELTVSPGKQIVAYDAIQKYPNIKVPFVKRLKITGRNAANVALTGEELATQTAFGGFSGTITEIGATFIEITVRGTATFDQAIEATSEAFESDAVCN